MAKEDKEKEEHSIDQELVELAVMTRNWARRTGAYVSDDPQFLHGHFTVELWCDTFEQSPFMWKRVKRKLIEMGEPLTFDEFGGHYLGNPGSQSKSVLVGLKYIQTLASTMHDHIEAMVASGQWDDCRLFLEDGLANSGRDLEMTDITKLLSGVGMKLEGDFEKHLLDSPQNINGE